MSEAPLKPVIDLELVRALHVCNCCGVDNGTVKLLRFRWSDPEYRQLGGTGIALCSACRDLTREVLRNEI